MTPSQDEDKDIYHKKAYDNVSWYADTVAYTIIIILVQFANISRHLGSNIQCQIMSVI